MKKKENTEDKIEGQNTEDRIEGQNTEYRIENTEEKTEEKNTENNTENTEKKEKKTTKAKKSKQSKKTTIKKTKSKKYQESVKDFDKRKEFTVEEAVEKVKELSYSKFDGTITLDIKLSKAKKGEEAIRGTIKVPNPTGKTQKVVIASDEIIEKIKKGQTDFDILLTSPEMMPKLGQVAKILGPKGKMPNPKDGTVVENPEAAIKEIESTVRYRMDAGRNLHIAVGKVSFDSAKLVENIRVILKAIIHLKKDSATLSPTMGVGVRIAL